MNSLKYPLEILIKVKTDKLKLLKEKLQEVKLKGLHLENQLLEIVQQKKEFEEEIRLKRIAGNLKDGKRYDLYLQSIKEKLQALAIEKQELDQVIIKHQEELLAVLIEKKRFDKLKEKRILKATKNDRFFD